MKISLFQILGKCFLSDSGCRGLDMVKLDMVRLDAHFKI